MNRFRRTSCGIVVASLISMTLLCEVAGGETGKWETPSMNRLSITEVGAVGDGQTLNTSHLQSAIDRLAKKGGGTVVIPKGVYLSGAIFLKPGVNLYLEEGAVLKGSTDIVNYPKMRTRVEGQFVNWIPALMNADHCDHLSITGSGTLDGSGQVFYTKFWNARKRDPKVTNL